MRNLLAFLFLSFSFFGAYAQSKQEQEVLALSKAKFKWIVSKNIDSLTNVLDERLTFIHSNGWMQTKKELIDDLQSGKLNYVNIEVTSASARTYPKSAVVTGRGAFTFIMDGKTSTVQLAYTETYVLQKRVWKLASRHANRLP